MHDPVRIERHLRNLTRMKLIGPFDLAAGGALLWSCGRKGDRTRPRGGEETVVTLARLATLAGMGRRRAVKAVQRLRAVGVLVWRQTRVRASWGQQEASRQGPNAYRWVSNPPAPTEGTPGPVHRRLEKERGIEGRWYGHLRPRLPLRSVAEQIAFCLNPSPGAL
jgi:hypothetical protein